MTDTYREAAVAGATSTPDLPIGARGDVVAAVVRCCPSGVGRSTGDRPARAPIAESVTAYRNPPQSDVVDRYDFPLDGSDVSGNDFAIRYLSRTA